MGRLVEFQNVKKTYHMGEVEIHAVDGVDFEINEGEFVVIVGPSGAGKTTVLNILGGMDKATSGHVIVDGVDISSFNSRQLTSYRRDDIGFVFQFYNLVQNLTALENVELALQICKDPLDAREVLTDVGLQDRMLNFLHSYLEGNSSVLLLQGHLQRIRNFFCVMNRQEHWTIRQVKPF